MDELGERLRCLYGYRRFLAVSRAEVQLNPSRVTEDRVVSTRVHIAGWDARSNYTSRMISFTRSHRRLTRPSITAILR